MGFFSSLFGSCDEKPKSSPPPLPPRAKIKLEGSVGGQQIHKVGTKDMLGSKSPTSGFSVVLEDDGYNGYFYALDNALKDQPILDSMAIYEVKKVGDRDNPSMFTILWSPDGLKAGLFINNYPHAVFDFAAKRGYCRTNFPEPTGDWTKHSHEWNDSALELFK
jgi:hypothetical protein